MIHFGFPSLFLLSFTQSDSVLRGYEDVPDSSLHDTARSDSFVVVRNGAINVFANIEKVRG